MKKTTLIAALVASAMSAPAFAFEGLYASADLGAVSLSNAGSLSSPTAVRVAVGTEGSQNGPIKLSNEVGLVMMSDASVNDNIGKIAMSMYSLQYNLIGAFPINDTGFDVTGRFGLSYNNAKMTTSGGYAGFDSASSTFGITYGIGARYNVNNKFAVNASWESLGKFKANSAAVGIDSTQLTIGGSYKF